MKRELDREIGAGGQRQRDREIKKAKNKKSEWNSDKINRRLVTERNTEG